ncbi:hypothetical protein N302_07020, partial [Corvus brachyrhynchos]
CKHLKDGPLRLSRGEQWPHSRCGAESPSQRCRGWG